jgi:MSHA biogenesis protein MshK
MRSVSDQKDETGHVRKVIGFSLGIAFVCAFAQSEPRAQGLQDPMRPPGVAPAGAAGRGAVPASGLQAIITSPGRKLAVIDGAVVPLGATVRDGTLAGVSDSVAVLNKNGERGVLLMHPNIDKRPARPADTKANAP